jgi:hypothetical protein
MKKEFNFVPNIYSRFLSNVKTNGFNAGQCWLWSGASKGNGYGNFNYKGKTTPSHRVAYFLFINDKIDQNLDVCHTCDVRHCVNPDHLFLGTRKDNMTDMRLKGRGDGGCRKHLKEWQIQEIKQRLTSGHSSRKIATSMDINYSTINSIKNGDSYGK